MTGIGSGEILKYKLDIAANLAKLTNNITSSTLGTNEAARITCIKPSGTTSLVLGTASGIHAWHAPYYLRTMRFNKNEDIASYLMLNHPELCEDDVLRPTDTVCVRIPVKAPDDSILRTETAIDTLERVKRFSTEWVKSGHINGANTHNVSATISINSNRKYTEFSPMGSFPPNDSVYKVSEDGTLDEWEVVGQWMWNEQEHYNGLSVLPAFDHTYKQAPFEDITEEQYNTRINTLKAIDLNKVMEIDDNVEFSQVAACAGGACEIA